MAARGARSRKTLDKTIEKQERKKEAKAIAQSFGRADSPSKWEVQSKSDGSAKSIGQRRPSVAGHHGLSRPSSASGMSSMSSESKEKAKYQTKGKESSHPRGRGGGVPIKSAAVERPPTRTQSSARTANEGRGASKNHFGLMMWYGSGIKPQPYRGLEQDTDLWMETGDCFIYFTEETDGINPRPALRLHKSELEKAKSTLLSNMLRYSAIERDVDEIELFPRIPSMKTQGPARTPLGRISQGSYSSDEARLPRWDSLDRPVRPLNRRTGTTDSSRSPVSPRRMQTIDEPLFSPSSDKASSSAGYSNPDETEITHEVWFPSPAYLKTQQAIYRHYIAQRNFFAVLYSAPIVGSDFFDMLNELQAVIDTFYELDNKSQTQWSAQMVARYLLRRKMDDVRHNIKMALGLLAWCEKDTVRWMGGYLEAFVHCAGMMTPSVLESFEFRRLSTVTRMCLNNAANMLQLGVMEAEERLALFDLPELWLDQAGRSPPPSPYQQSFAAFREFLVSYYKKSFRSWPPPPNGRGRWLTRDLARQLQRDFGALYEYLVDRSVTWSEQEASASRKWQMVRRKPLEEPLTVDNPRLPLTDMVVGFDNRHAYQHIPHPYPLLSHTIRASPPLAPVKKSLFGGLKKQKSPPPRDPKEQLQIALAFNDATNLDKLGTAFHASDIIDRFERYEKESDLQNVSPREARLGRWILLYGILETLSTLSVDTLGLKHKDGCDYFLCPSLKKCPPWDPNGTLPMAEATQSESYCWRAPEGWDQMSLDQGNTAGDRDATPTSLTEIMDDKTRAISELDGRSLSVRRLDRDFGGMHLEDKGVKYRLESPGVPERSPLRGIHIDRKDLSFFEEDSGIRFIES